MSFQSGSATDPTDLLQQLATWLVSIGWTQDRNASEGSGWTFSGHKSGNYVHLRSTMNESAIWQHDFGSAYYGLNLYLGTGFSSGSAWNAQAGAPLGSTSNPIGVGMHLSAGPFSNYYFFSDAAHDNIVVVVEKTPGLYLHLGWGLSLLKAGTWTGGPYFFGSTSSYYVSYGSAGAGTPGFTTTSDCPFAHIDAIAGGCCFVRADVDSFTGKWIGLCGNNTGPDQGYTGKRGDPSTPSTGSGSAAQSIIEYQQSAGATDFSQCTTSALDGRANLIPLLLWALRDGTTTGFSLLGTPPFIFYSNGVGHGFANAEEYTIGPTTYKMFPNFAIVKQ
jgi:hypothetical protein